jgi:hypothetical protein
VVLRKLWAAVKRIPSGYVLAATRTPASCSAERDKGWLTLAVTDRPEPSRASTVTRYMVDKWAAPNPPPLYQHMAALDDLPPARWRRASVAGGLQRQAGALEVTTGEIAAPLDQVNLAELRPLAMAFKLIESARRRWRMVIASHLVALVRAGPVFVNSKLVERPDDRAPAARLPSPAKAETEIPAAA